ncbi:MAG: hypothetical protein QF645_00185 [Planctomycetota bacterium]|nr:hypothetical protein [Planctomycetota bacterium]
MIWIKVTPLFLGAFLLMMVLARMSEKKGEGEVPFVLGPSNDLASSPEEEAFPLMDPTKNSTVKSDRPLMVVETSVQEVVLW